MTDDIAPTLTTSDRIIQLEADVQRLNDAILTLIEIIEEMNQSNA